MFCLNVCMCSICMQCSSPKEASDLWELRLQIVVSRHVGAWNRTLVLCKSNKCS